MPTPAGRETSAIDTTAPGSANAERAATRIFSQCGHMSLAGVELRESAQTA